MSKKIVPSPKIYALIRAGFVAQGTSLNRFCQEHGFGRQNARHACLGTWKGPKGKEALAWLYEESQKNEFPTKSPDGQEFLTNKNQATD